MFSVIFEPWQIVAISCIFVWGGIIRSSMGFGGAALTMPLLLLVYPDPVFFLPIIGVHLLIFGLLGVYSDFSAIDWGYLRKIFPYIVVPKILGVWGVLHLPTDVIVTIIYLISCFLAIGLIFNKFNQMSGNVVSEKLLLMVGGYISGTNLSGAPAIVPVVAKCVNKDSLRVTLFTLWAILVCIKLIGFYLAESPFYFEYHLWLLPAATIGHFIGLRLHLLIKQLPDKSFYCIVGCMLFVLGCIGMMKLYWNTLTQLFVQ